MSNKDVLGMCFRSLYKRKLRTFLTILGVIIGTACIVTMISLGLAVSARFDGMIDDMGDVTIINVYGGNQYMAPAVAGGGASARNQPTVLDDNMITQFNRIPGVVAATAIVSTYGYFKSGKYSITGCQILGISPSAMEALGYAPSQGRLLEMGDKSAAIVGRNFEAQFYKMDNRTYYSERYEQAMQGIEIEPLIDVMSDRINMSLDYRLVYSYESAEENTTLPKIQKLNVMGVLESKDYNADSSIFMDITVVQQMIKDEQKRQQAENESYGYYSGNQNQNRNTGYDRVLVKCKDLDNVRSVSEAIQELGFYAEFPTQYLDSLQSMTQGLQAMLGAVGAVSMLVAAIGIANTMVMSVVERTREIGVMKVIGAKLSDIRKIFLTEAAIIGAFGGCAGVGLSLLLSFLLNNSQLELFQMFLGGMDSGGEKISLITSWLCGAAIGFSAFVGLFSGYFPARRAMKLSALNAIRADM
ncbi:MAG: ABC transporter permease [Clostridiales bacterium]|jgi:ABC-type lipoprotein release transport system permease subunit|nr:ABC transporter permease [Clostridiales bacterium]